MNLEKAYKALQSEKYRNYIFHGQEDYYLDQIAAYVNKELVPESQKDFNYHLFYGKDTDVRQIVDAAGRAPMGAPYVYILVKEAQSIKGLEKIENYWLKPNPQAKLILIYKKKLDKRKKSSKVLLQNAYSDESKSPYENQIPDWITKECQRRNMSLDADAVRTLSEYIGNNLSVLSGALEKLQLNNESGITVTGERVQNLIGINKEYNVFALQSAVASRDRKQSMRIIQYYSRNPKGAPLVLVINSLFGFFSKLSGLSQKRVSSMDAVRRVTGIRHPGALHDYMQGLRNYNGNQIDAALHLLHQADLRSKGVGARGLGTSEVLKELIGRILVDS